MNNDKKTIFDEETTKEMLNKFDKINLGNISDNGIILYQEEALNEDTLYKKKGDEYIIEMHPRDSQEVGFVGDPYIKVIHGKNYIQADTIIRILLKSGKTKIHTTAGKTVLKLNSEIRKWIIKTLNMPCTNKEFKDDTVYDAAWKVVKKYAGNTSVAEYVPYDEFVKMFKANNK